MEAVILGLQFLLVPAALIAMFGVVLYFIRDTAKHRAVDDERDSATVHLDPPLVRDFKDDLGAIV